MVCRMSQIIDYHKVSFQVEGLIESLKTSHQREKRCLVEVCHQLLARKTQIKVDVTRRCRELKQPHLDKRIQLSNFRTI